MFGCRVAGGDHVGVGVGVDLALGRLLVEADPTGGSAMLAGFFRGTWRTLRG